MHESISPQSPKSVLDRAHLEIDKRFATEYSSLFSTPKVMDLSALSHKMVGEKALESGYYDQAVNSLNRVIEKNPVDSFSYLDRSSAYFHKGEYDQAIEDFHAFQATSALEESKVDPLSLSEFSVGFAKGVPQGVYESGEGILLFLTDFVSHPIHTSKQMFEAISTLVDLAKSNEWEVIGEVLAPEVHQLITEWERLPSDKRGELAGYALGKHGTDIFAPAALVKLTGKGAKSAKELAELSKKLKKAQETLLLEAAAEVGNTAKFAEIVESGQKTAFLAEELGFSGSEMGMLKKSGTLESTISSSYEHLNLPMQESLSLFKAAEKKLKPYQGKYLPESKIRKLIHETGIFTLPRPKGLPENFRVKISSKGAGMIYFHPEHTHTSIRVMPGKPHSPFPHQKKPYVIYRKNGNTFDKFGNIVDSSSPEAHISFDEFIFRD